MLKGDNKINNFSRRILYFLTLTIIIIIGGFLFNNQSRFILNAVCIYSAYWVAFYYEKKGVIKTTRLVKTLLVLVILLHLVGGQYLNLYETSPYFDKVLHLVGSFTIALFIYQVLLSLVGVHLSSRLLVFILISSVVIASGVFIEILEFAIDMLFKSANQKSLADTNFDMISNIIGSSLAGLSVIRKK